MLKLADYVRPELTFELTSAESQRQVFELAAAKLVERGTVPDAAALIAELERREAQGPTGVGHGLALPHAILDGVTEPAVVIVRLGRGMPWGGADDEPVRVVVIIVAAANRRSKYLELLAELARSLNQPSVQQAVLAARNPRDIVRAITNPPHAGFFERHRRLAFFGATVLFVYAVAQTVLPRIVLPSTGPYASEEFAHLSEPVWLFRQNLTVTLFFGMVLGTLLFWRFRVAIAAAALGILLVAGVMDLDTTVKFMSIPTILFIMSMMVIVKWLENIGVFRYLVTKAIQQVRGIPWLLLLFLMGFSVLLGGFADEVSAILVTFGLALEVSRRTRTPLVPYLLCLVFATNVGSAVTLVGNPIGVYIAFAGKLSFEHFLRWATPVSVLAAVVTAAICLLLYRKQFFGQRYNLDLRDLERSAENVDFTRLRTGIITFVTVILLVAIHRRVELLLNLAEGTALVAEALLVVGFIVFYEQEKGRLLVERGIDWWTLLFFMFLFANAACLEYTGVTTKLGYVMLNTSRAIAGAAASPANVTGVTAVLMLWFSGLTSGFVDNLPIVAALVPVVKDLARAGLPHASILWWALLFGGCFGGNLTVIGSTANLVAVGAFEKVSGKSVRFVEWLKYGLIITAVSLVVATAALLLQLRLAP